MGVSENAARSNNPTARENTAHMDDLKDLLEAKIQHVAGIADERQIALVKILEERDLRFMRIVDERELRYLDKFRSMDEKTGLALAANEKAVAKAEVATEKRFDSVNEFRAQLKDQASTLMPREEANIQFGAFSNKMEELKDDIIKLREFKSQTVAVTTQVERHTETDRSKYQFNTATLITIIFSTIATLASFYAIISRIPLH